MSDSSIAKRLSFHRIDADAIDALRAAKPFVLQVLPGILDEFYQHVGQYPETVRFFRNREHMAHAKEMQLKHWGIILDGGFDDAYETSVTRIGEVHNKLGLEPRWYIGGYNALVSSLIAAIAERMSVRWFDRQGQIRKVTLQRAIVKAAMLDMDIAISVYIEAGRRDRKALLNRLAIEFESAVGSVVSIVASAATELEASARSLQAATDLTSSGSGAAAAASGDSMANVNAVAAASEQLSSSISEISRRVNESSVIVSKAAEGAEQAAHKIDMLSAAGQKIGTIVDLITNIASQTNLLALNATIEAARAGEAGRGFAVVASEVKGLAEQTAKATADIASQVGDIQSSTTDSVKAISEINEVIRSMSEVSTAIASAVEEQSAATGEISRNAQLAASGTLSVSQSVEQVKRAAGDAGATSAHVLTAAGELSQQSELLRAEVSKFLNTVRAA
ncbi:globin-coupled sensor protein [Bradyrhizobium manausense]|uniref:globin-coupled sensor protein n=1 Tax=Bradyrhizobium manausense TaxID=989370 RepID=UPI00201211F0|nr:globin-coupled sensor protein [Bradyrhizobium manausense]